MKRVLILTYYFPPEGGPAVQRVAKFAKYLNQYGYQPCVVTSHHPVEIHDSDLFRDVRSLRDTHAVKDRYAYLPGEIQKYFKKKLVPDKHVYWHKPALAMIKKLHREKPFDIIFSTSPPHSVHLTGLKAKEICSIPWVADFRDEWSYNPDFVSWAQIDRQLQMESDVLKSCDHVTTITNLAAQHWKELNANVPVSVIRNGYDKADFKDTETAADFRKIMVFSYSGRLNATHSPHTFFRALDALLYQKEVDNTRIRVSVLGNNDEKVWASSYFNLKTVMDFPGYLSHSNCLKNNRAADVLLLFSTGMKESEALPAKLFEYMYLRKPILAIVDKESELTSILREYGNAYICIENELEQTKAAIMELYNGWQKDNISKPIDDTFLQQFDRKHTTGQLAAVFDSLLT